MDISKTIEVLQAEMAKSEGDNQFRDIFTKFDDSKSGVISKDQFVKAVDYLNEGRVTDINLEEIFQRADIDKDGKLNFQEFKMAFFAMAIAEFSLD